MASIKEGLAKFVVKTLGQIGILSEVLSVVDASVWSTAKSGEDNRSLKKLKEDELQEAYHKKSFVKPIVNGFLSFLCAGGGFTITGKNKPKVQELNDFWRSPRVQRD
jgi:hypothetical protein